MNAVGGYFEVEYSNINLNIHFDSIKLNTARNCLEYIITSRGYKMIYIPYYTCDVLLEPIQKLKICYSFYHINERLEPINIPILEKDEALLYINYFGVKNAYVNSLCQQFKNIIIDNSQALFAPVIEYTDTFYSLRKFVGVPDGAFLYCNNVLDITCPSGSSFDRVSHLFKRKDVNASYGYEDFKLNDKSLTGLPITTMSASTAQFIITYDFSKNRYIRERNFLYLHQILVSINELEMDIGNLCGPLCYPLLVRREGLKEELISNNILIPTYWPNVTNRVKDMRCFEAFLMSYLICLPIDQRYSIEDMKYISKLILC